MNEGNHIPYAIADVLMVRSKEIWIDFNADEEFWVHTEVLTEENSELLKLTYLDNEALPEEIAEELMIKKAKAFHDVNADNLFAESNIKDAHWANWWRIYGMGEVGTYSDRRIYNFEIVKEIPPHAKKLPRGMDFGSSPDPTCLVDLYLDGIDLYLDEVFCENNLIAEKIKGAERDSVVDRMNDIALNSAKETVPYELWDKDNEYYLANNSKELSTDSDQDKKIKQQIRAYKAWKIAGDPSGATELRDLARHGFTIVTVNKRGGVPKGIKRLQSYSLKVTERSTNIKTGMETWFRKVDANGKIIGEPDGHEPDTLAAARYSALAKVYW